IALLPIGAYFPDSFRNVHMGPDEAVKVFRDIGAHWLIPMHFGTFKLSFEAMDEPPRWLKEIAERDGIAHHIKVLEEGVPTVF
ncbi:MAG TPA: MBL fold metallo-hydrolase, partial [Candidatus Acidoferrum sp.]|nr:MBL fold metallo-hydrolase [Candidatus Acidoferrum sp.]